MGWVDLCPIDDYRVPGFTTVFLEVGGGSKGVEYGGEGHDGMVEMELDARELCGNFWGDGKLESVPLTVQTLISCRPFIGLCSTPRCAEHAEHAAEELLTAAFQA